MGAFYRAYLSTFSHESEDTILGRLTGRVSHNELQRKQIKAWQREIKVCKSMATVLQAEIPESRSWSLLLEYPIPRRSKRLDAVLLANDLVVCIEFKTEDSSYATSAKDQIEEYALDLRDFHEASRNLKLFPILVAPKAPAPEPSSNSQPREFVAPVQCANAETLPNTIMDCFRLEHSNGAPTVDPSDWDDSVYRPVPTIIEAAETLFAGHNVREIVHSHAGSKNITETSDAIISAIRRAQADRKKLICFITGVPGAGKTLAGLNIVHNPALRDQDRPAGIFLSGNGPLVKIVAAALARDCKRRAPTGDEQRTSTTFIQNVHNFISEGLDKPDKPQVERVVVFDEAQRAWSAEHNHRKNGVAQSEPELMLSIMDRHPGWAAIVALVGAGQEINTGEAGLEEWGSTLRKRFPHWQILVSPMALEPNNATNAGHCLFPQGKYGNLDVVADPALHLDVNVRSYRAQALAEWVEAVLSGESDEAARLMSKLARFPIAMTRSLATARDWLRSNTRGKRRCGLVASSGALRLRAEGLELSSGFRQGNRDMYVNWFLNDAPDVRSSNQLEVAASEYECQGLELDWVCVCWAGDLSRTNHGQDWQYRAFAGKRWGSIGEEKQRDRSYLLNTYRVLLTRARQGCVVFIPKGDEQDATRPAVWFDETAAYLVRCGLRTV